ncbi:MAG: hypothetical protein H6581_30835 [Bacteroidia bacterium]|nr:hypothetical protein [Bacteroidia bacterium]
MGIVITKHKKLAEVQEEFHAKFPYLKLEFFSKSHGEHEGSPRKNLLNHNLTVSEAGNFDHNEELSLDGHTRVRSLEHLFHDHFGLNVQVFRKSGTAWLQTTATDDWTLSHQNEVGHEDSHFPVE